MNSAADDFCPTPVRGGGLFFVSREANAGSCGLGDIYFTRNNPSARAGRSRRNLGCAPAGPNSALDEQGPSYVENGRRARFLYFSSSSAAVPGDIYVSPRLAGLELRRTAPVPS